MFGFINNYNFKELEPQKYWAPPASWSIEKKKETTRNRIFSGDWLAAEKKDGYFSKFLKDEDGNILLFSRSKNVNNEYPEKHEWVPHLQEYFEKIPNGSCFLGELYLPNMPGSKNVTTLLGCLKDKCVERQNKNEKLHFYIFDILAFNNVSFLDKTAINRFAFIKKIENIYNSEYIEYAQYSSGIELWQNLQSILSSGREGMVLIRNNSLYQPGKRPSKDCQKIKKELSDTIDAFFTGKTMPATEDYKGKEIETWQYWQDMRTGEKFLDNESNTYKRYINGEMIKPITRGHFYGWAGSLEVGVYNKEGKIVPIAWLSGLPDEIKAAPEDFTMKPFEMIAMQIHEDTEGKGLRHAKFLKWRPDNSLKDCTYEKIFGEQ